MATFMWTGTLRTASGARSPRSGEEIEVRIGRTEGALFVEWNSGTDGMGITRWMPIDPRHLDPASLCAALVDSSREDA